ncbi:bifunctional folylpolyglutamate synthase/dihydrofolate synthase [Egbenema bharatensis]|uniref:bifunctional folylpolyglutamate synthase/dihydrofolate synthase n=1 Tax=Egbenema bharatensis TaxID=3463334 RepID=UPI003A8356A8
MSTAETHSHSSKAADPLQQSALTQIDVLLDRFTHFGVELGLERIQRLLAALGNPQEQVPIVHVAGSNGKGSVCAYLSSVLTEAGYRVGRYTSPHLVTWCERICINQKDITAIELLRVLQTVIAAIDPDTSSPTQFEVITAAAWLYFAQQQVDIAVIEVGLGGRLDATNVCDRPLVSVITSLSLEHCQKLGPTLTHIAGEKAGILKPHCPAVIAPQPPEATTALSQRLTHFNCPTLWVEPAADLGNGWAEFTSTFNQLSPPPMPGQRSTHTAGLPTSQPAAAPASRLRYPLPLPGLHQLTNSAVAIAALQILQQQGWQITEEHLIQGMDKTAWRGRMQWLEWQGEPILIDGAHNPAGAKLLRHYIDHSDRVVRPVCWVMGLLTTKEPKAIFNELLRPGDALVLVPVPDHLSADPQQLADIAHTLCPDLQACHQEPDVMTGLKTAMTLRSDRQPSLGTIVLCGSLYLIGDFFKQI